MGFLRKHSTRILLVLFALYVIGLTVIVISVSGGPATVDLINEACRAHDGVARLDRGYAICRDGYAAEY